MSKGDYQNKMLPIFLGYVNVPFYLFASIVTIENIPNEMNVCKMIKWSVEINVKYLYSILRFSGTTEQF